MSREELKKHVAAVHCSGVLSRLERMVFNVLLLQAYDKLLEQPSHQIPVRALCVLVGYDSNDWLPLKNALRSICTTAVEFNLLGDGGVEKRWSISGMMADATLENGLCTYSYSPTMSKELYSPEVYTRINVLVQREFKSAFSLNLHENCLRFRNLPATGWWPLPLFRKLVGAEAGMYNNFPELRRRVIDVAVGEINQYSEIEITPEYERDSSRGHPVKAVRFLISQNKQRSLFPITDGNDEVRASAAYKELKSIGLEERLIFSAIAENEVNALAVARRVREGAQAGKIRNPGAYAATMFEKGVVLTANEGVEDQGSKKKKKALSSGDGTAQAEERRRQKVRFESERRTRANKLLTSELRAELIPEWVAHERGNGNEAALRGWTEASSVLVAPASAMFEIYATNRLLGEYTEADFEGWLREQRSAGAKG